MIAVYILMVFLGTLSVLCFVKASQYSQYGRLKRENAYLRAALAPLLAHADADDKAPPIKFSVSDCRKIKEKVNAPA